MRSAEALGKVLATNLRDFGGVGPTFTLNEIKKMDGLKTHLMDDPFTSIEINSESEFEVSLQPSDLICALLRDYLNGVNRSEKQTNTLKVLAKNEHLAWAVVTAYYLAFFCAIEILRIFGMVYFSFDDEDAKRFFGKATGVAKKEFLANSPRNFIGVVSKDFASITFKKDGVKPHQSVWQHLERKLRELPKKTLTIVEIGKFKAMCGGDASWEKPSSIRNRWNYRDAAYFNETGFNSAQPFLKLLNDKHAASQWIVNQSTIRNENEKIASLAAITQFLSSALDESYNYGFLTLLVRNE